MAFGHPVGRILLKPHGKAPPKVIPSTSTRKENNMDIPKVDSPEWIAMSLPDKMDLLNKALQPDVKEVKEVKPKESTHKKKK